MRWFLESGCGIELYDHILGLVRETEFLNEIIGGIVRIRISEEDQDEVVP